jgi:hypothetical protein
MWTAQTAIYKADQLHKNGLKKAVVAYFLRHYPGVLLDGLMITTKNLSQDSRSPCRHSNLGPPEYEVGLLITTFGVKNTKMRKSYCVYPMYHMFLGR